MAVVVHDPASKCPEVRPLTGLVRPKAGSGDIGA